MKSILNPSFRYVPSHATDLRKSFARIRRERESADRPPAETVVHINAKKETGRK
jgi:hypothetical protein